ncbi:MAG: S26 family signal peptidase [Chitinispirillaceae bacterium]
MKKTEPADFRLALYRGTKQFLLVLGVGVLIKFTILDSIVVNGSQMSPAVGKGDRIILFRTPYLPGLRTLMSNPSTGKPVLCRLPGKKENTLLRVAGASGDTAAIDSGTFHIGSQAPEKTDADPQNEKVVLPADYSPRDFMDPYRIPAPGDSIRFGELSLRDFFFSFSVLRQENPESHYDLDAALFIDDTASNTYFIKDFTLYRGTLESVPEHLRYDWFFWDRLQAYLRITLDDRDFRLEFKITQGGDSIEGFTVQDRYLFLLGDNNEKALDSRYYGPVNSSLVFGRPVMTLWSCAQNSAGKRTLSFSRFGRFIN